MVAKTAAIFLAAVIGELGGLYAAYAGVFLLGAMLWSWVLDGLKPDRFDTIGAILVLAGITTILWGRVLFT